MRLFHTIHRSRRILWVLFILVMLVICLASFYSSLTPHSSTRGTNDTMKVIARRDTQQVIAHATLYGPHSVLAPTVTVTPLTQIPIATGSAPSLFMEVSPDIAASLSQRLVIEPHEIDALTEIRYVKIDSTALANLQRYLNDMVVSHKCSLPLFPKLTISMENIERNIDSSGSVVFSFSGEDVSLWSGMVRIDPDGHVDASFADLNFIAIIRSVFNHPNTYAIALIEKARLPPMEFGDDVPDAIPVGVPPASTPLASTVPFYWFALSRSSIPPEAPHVCFV